MRLITIALASLPVLAQIGPPPQVGRMAPRTFSAPPEMKPGKSSIEGNVTNAVTHEPIKKATVTLYGTSQLTAVTDDAGHFAFRQLPKGSFMVAARSPQFAQQMTPPPNIQVTVGEEEAKTGIELKLVPGGSISGRVVDEEGSPVAGCNVSVMNFDTLRGARRLAMRGAASTDDHGSYHLLNIAKGKYYVMARCYQNIPLPHAFIRRAPDAEIPTLAYEPQLYPGTMDVTSAMKVAVSPGSDTLGIDFKIAPAAGITLRGHISTPESGTSRRFLQVRLVPKDSSLTDLGGKFANLNRQTGSFRIEHVMPGSYELIAYSRGGEDGNYMARMPVEAGNTELPPIELTLQPPTSVKGAVLVEGSDDKSTPSLEGMRIVLQPHDADFVPPAQAQVQKDGSFVLSNVANGTFNVFVSGPAAFVKSIAIADRDAPDNLIDYTRGVAGPLKITMSTKWAQLHGSISNVPADVGPVNGMVWPADSSGNIGSGNRMFGVSPGGGTFTLGNLAPGKYHACAVQASDVWPLMRNAELLDALKTRCTSVELKDGETANVQIAFIPAGDLQRLLEEADR